ncbi:hypothetical protein BS47DRAFT_23104 [Hydnum rufescens UP504]|uniref:Rad21/Rec8-like protein C-terminal eukaryotic domain-containing protein n=1 Tax=Hydnum rufescens UP504 TaxID=1448309 RepID=A0A9P6DYB0_9AGAM|nr:hypothetical protein BS47DRAFT_23104 [Hydnum rufescens UP504]
MVFLMVLQFCDPAPQESNVHNESQLSEVSHPGSLERNSHNFLEYSKSLMLSNGGDSVMLTTIVPVATSTPHVAAAAFYHCLVLATKHLIRLRQDAPYDDVIISVL